MFRLDTNLWYKLFQSFLTYLRTEIYQYNETGIEIYRIIDSLSTNTPNPNITGNTFVIDENSIYDETGTLIRNCVARDKFTNPSKEQDYFICEYDDKMYPITDKNNNTRIGNLGIYLSMGEVEIDGSDPILIEELPCMRLRVDSEDPKDMLAREDVDTDRILNFDIELLVSEQSLYTNIGATGYDETNFLKGTVEALIYDYYNSSQCQVLDGDTVARRINQWVGGWNMLAERNNDNLRFSVMSQNITYK